MEIPSDILTMLAGAPLKTSARNMTQLSHALSDGVVIAHVIHKVFPRLLNMHTYTPSNSEAGKIDNWKTMNEKCLVKMKVKLSDDDIRSIARRSSQELLVTVLREIRMKMRAYEPLYVSGSDKPVSQAEKDALRAKQYSRNNPPLDKKGNFHYDSSSGLDGFDDNDNNNDNDYNNDNNNNNRRMSTGKMLDTSSLMGGSSSSAGGTTTNLYGTSSGAVSPPPRIRSALNSEQSRRPSRLAASIAASLGGAGTLSGENKEDLLLGSKGRRASQLQRTKEREKHAKLLRNSKDTTQITVTENEMDQMFSSITGKLNDDLAEHTQRLDRLDVKSRQFDSHMAELRLANKKEMTQTDHNLANVLRAGTSSAEPGFGFGRPEFVTAPQDGSNSFVGLVSPHSNQIAELVEEWGEGEGHGHGHGQGGEQYGEQYGYGANGMGLPPPPTPPPPPPSHPPPAHILEKRGSMDRVDEDEDEDDDVGDGFGDGAQMQYNNASSVTHNPNFKYDVDVDVGVGVDGVGGEENFNLHLSNNNFESDESDEDGDEPGYDMGLRQSQSQNQDQDQDQNWDQNQDQNQDENRDKYNINAMIEEANNLSVTDVLSGKTPTGRPSPQLEAARKVRTSMSVPVDESPTGVEWCEVFHEEHRRHYYLHHTGVSQWEKPSQGTVQCADPNNNKPYYVNLATGVSSWVPPI